MDEEASLVDKGYKKPAIRRYSATTMRQASAVFAWGEDDYRTLREHYPLSSYKVHKTGSPRVDLWTPHFASYWKGQVDLPSNPYVLVSSNTALANNRRPFHEVIKLQSRMGYFERDAEMFALRFHATAEDYQKTLVFIDAIKCLGEAAHGYEIIFRPHPSEEIEAWRVYLAGVPNVRVVRDGPITPWVQNVFALIHNSCTSSIEAAISGIPVLTYLPFKQSYGRDIPNNVGIRVNTPEGLARCVQALFERSCGRELSLGHGEVH